MKKHIGQVVTLNFKDMESILGLILDFNDEWILMRNIPVDYVVDGYFLVRNKNIKSIVRGDDEKWREKIVKIKTKRIKPIIIPIDNLEIILKTLTKKYKVFTLYTKEEGICWLGRLKNIDDKILTISDLTPKAKWDGEMEFNPNKIRCIEFDTDYINSLKLLAK